MCRPFSVKETVPTIAFVSQLSCSRSHGCIVQNTRVTSVRAARRKLVKLFKKPKSKFYWYDFTARGRRYRASTQETKSIRALQIASLKLAAVMERTDPLPTKPAVLQEFADRFLAGERWQTGRQNQEVYRNGWRLLASTSVAMLRLDQITGDGAEQLTFPGSAANANCALRTLRRILHKAEEWKVIAHAPKIKMMKEHGRHLRLDDEAERKLIAGALTCNWRPRTRVLFQDIVILMRDTGMRNERELFRMRVENLDWQNRVIFVPDSKTVEGRRLVPMRRGLGISVQALRVRAPKVNLQSLPKSPQQSGPSERIGSLLCATRLWYASSDANRQPCGCNANDGAPRRKDRDALSAPGTRNRARCARLPSANI
jgi:integrase